MEDTRTFFFVVLQEIQADCDDEYTSGGAIQYHCSDGHTHGDPHFNTFHGYRFSYHGECDLVLVYNQHFSRGSGLRVHIRTKIRQSYSFVQGAAVQIGNEVFEITTKKYFLNGEVVHDLPDNFAGYKMEYLNSLNWCAKRNCTDTVIVKLDLDEDGSIHVATYKGFLYVKVRGGEAFQNATGILGSTGVDGQFARDGNQVFDDMLFAEGWQVLDKEPKLFVNNRYPQHPDSCIAPPENTMRRIIDASGSLYKIALTACSSAGKADKDFCIFEVIETGDVDMAMPYTVCAF